MKYIKLALLIAIISAFVSWAFINALDSSFDNKDRMLCNSALDSGNEEYLEKCECFYSGEDIRCIYDN